MQPSWALLFFLLPAAAAPGADPLAGLSFEDVGATLGEVDFTAAAADPKDPQLLYAAAAGVVYRSADGGRSWQLALGRSGAAASSAAQDRLTEVSRGRELRAQDLLDDALERLRSEVEEEVVARLEDELGREAAEAEAAVEAERELERERPRLALEARRRAEQEVPLEEVATFTRSSDVAPGGFVAVHDLRAGAPGELLVATDEGLYRSSDGGLTLQQLVLGMGGDRAVTAIGQDPRQPGRIYAGTRGGLFVGESGLFTTVFGEVGLLPVNDLDVDGSAPDRVAVATDSGLFVSHDAGRSFAEVQLLPAGAGQRVVAVRWDAGTPGRGFAGTEDGTLYASEDGGQSFERLAPSGLRGALRALHAPEVSAGADPLLYAATDSGLFVSADGGDAFEELYSGLASRDVRAVATPAGAPGAPLAATARGMFQLGAQVAPIPPRIRDELRRIARREPRPEQVVAAALRSSGLQPGEARARRVRARWAAAGPSVSAVATRWLHEVTTERRPDLDPVLGSEIRERLTRRSQNLGARVDWALFGSWDLQRAIFNDDELAVERQARREQEAREATTNRVVTIFMARRRLIAEQLAAPPGDARAGVLKLLHVEEQTARLDGLTGGWFSSELDRRASSPPEAP